jgi:hypothetical protein
MKAVLSCVVVAALLPQSAICTAQPSCRMTVPVIALAQKPIGTFTANDFLAKVRRNEVLIEAIGPPPPTRRFVFVLDRSGSMTHNPSLNAPIKLGLENALSTIKSTDAVAFVVFAGRDSQQTEFLKPELAEMKIPGMLAWKPEVKGGGLRTPLWDNIHVAVQMLAPHKAGDVVVVISDGGDNSSKLDIFRVEDELKRVGITLLAMVTSSLLETPEGLLETPEDEQGRRSLAELAEATGGTAATLYQQRPDAEPIGIWQAHPNPVISQLAYQFSFDLDLPPIHKPEDWNLSVKSPEMQNSIHLFYSRTLYPCSSTQ